MGDNLYTSYWQSVLPKLIEQFKAGNQTAQLEVNELSSFGDRQNYYANFRIINGELDIPKNAYAQGRDLHQVLIADEYFKENLSNSTIQVTISKDLILKMEILDTSAPDFFTEQDFEQLARFEKERMDENNQEHKVTYEFLKGTYNKLEYWAKEVQKKLFLDGIISIRKRPTNQASRFESYQWAKIFPDKASSDFGVLAYTVTIDTDNRFVVKVDTVGLSESDERRQTYLESRGEYTHSPIVKILPGDQVLDKGWKYLIDLTGNIINTLKPAYDELLQSFQGVQSAGITNEPRKQIAMSLNTIFYGPPGTGKTYKLQSLCKDFTITKAVQTREEFLEALIPELTWWETIAASLMDMKTASVPELEKHEFVKIKARQSTTSNVKQVIWGSLQSRTDLACENVKFTDRREPYIFWKEENSVWRPLEDRVKDECPEIMEFLNKANNFKPDAGSVQKNYRMITFHQNFSYEDFVEGIKPVFNSVETEKLLYEIQKGIFYQCCNDAAKLAGYESLTDCLNDTKESRQEKMKVAPPYALFIDEVNRANVSSVLGELITLIEDDKRLGGENEITNITLPYSKSLFGVPGNLYIIGTMNTADRSVEALDTALRRRFVFQEMAPEISVLNSFNLIKQLWIKYKHTYEGDIEWENAEKRFMDLFGMSFINKKFYLDLKPFAHNITEQLDELDPENFKRAVEFKNGVDLERLLNKINERLITLIGHDNTIGHAWLMQVFSLEELQTTFKNKILPLLQEFFYNDYAKIGLVLGKSFIESKPAGNQFAVFDNELSAEFTDKVIYSVKDISKLQVGDFMSIYQ